MKRHGTAQIRRFLTRQRVALLVCAVLSFGVLDQAHAQNQAVERQMGLPNDSAGEALGASAFQNQLDQLKHAFMTLAMDQKASIAASSWTDSNGTLGEDVMVFSGLKLEKLRPTLRRDRFGIETTALIYAPDASQESCASQQIRPQRLAFAVSTAAGGNAANQNMALAASIALQKNVEAALFDGRLANVSTLLPISGDNGPGSSAYMRYMTNAPQSSSDLQLQMYVSVADTKPLEHRFGLLQRVRPGKRLQVELNLVAQQAVVFSLEKELPLVSSRQASKDQMAWLELSKEAQAELASWLDAALVEVGGAVNCHGEAALGMTVNASQITLLGGSDAGVYHGQRLAILPTSQRLRSRGLQESLAVVGLAQVTRVGPRSATLTMYAGPGGDDISDMLAIPVAALTR